jgi:hypothetical protein
MSEFARQVRPKLHYFAHTLEHVLKTRENPRRQDLFGAEDYIGRIKKIGCRTHRLVCPLRVVERLLILKSHRWHKIVAAKRRLDTLFTVLCVVVLI